MSQIELIFLVTGTSAGIPMIGCHCEVCSSADPHDKRTRPSVVISQDQTRVLVDTSPELRLQAVANGIDTERFAPRPGDGARHPDRHDQRRYRHVCTSLLLHGRAYRTQPAPLPGPAVRSDAGYAPAPLVPAGHGLAHGRARGAAGPRPELLGQAAPVAGGVQLAEEGVEAEVDALFAEPLHPYTHGLLASIPRLEIMAGRNSASVGRLQEIPGMVPALNNLPPGCVFAPRCAFADDRCRSQYPAYEQLRPGHWVACWHSERLYGGRDG